MTINSFEISNLILDKKLGCPINNKYQSAFLSITDEEPTFSVNWGPKLIVNEYYKSFTISHPIFKKYTFKLINPQQSKRSVSLLGWMLNTQ